MNNTKHTENWNNGLYVINAYITTQRVSSMCMHNTWPTSYFVTSVLNSPNLLAHSIADNKFTLSCDASPFRVRAVFSHQRINESEQTIVYPDHFHLLENTIPNLIRKLLPQYSVLTRSTNIYMGDHSHLLLTTNLWCTCWVNLKQYLHAIRQDPEVGTCNELLPIYSQTSHS